MLGASWAPARADFGVEAVATGVARQSRLDETAGPLFHAPGHALFDVHAWWRPAQEVRVNLSLLNAFDRRHWDWSTVRGVSATASDLDFYTRSGRSLALSVSFAWGTATHHGAAVHSPYCTHDRHDVHRPDRIRPSAPVSA